VAEGRLPEMALLEQARAEVVEITALRRHPERGSLIVRLCNLEERPVQECLSLGARLRGAWRCDLLEEREAALPMTGRQLVVELGPAEILTLELELETLASH
jgi:alpha-mannosidase